MTRKIRSKYSDPLDAIWIGTARKLGIEVIRDSEVFAAWDGSGVLRIGTDDTLDPDDCVAQMIFHEICHALVEGPDRFNQPDWGLDIEDRTQLFHEHACLQLQASLAEEYSLRAFFGATTDFRSYYDELPADPFERNDRATPLAKAGWQRAKKSEWSQPLDKALQATKNVKLIAMPFADTDSLWKV